MNALVAQKVGVAPQPRSPFCQSQNEPQKDKKAYPWTV